MKQNKGVLEGIDLTLLDGSPGDRARLAQDLRSACTNTGFFYVEGHGVDDELQQSLDRAARHFFALPLEEKLEIRMALGGRAWRGYFPVGAELTSGKPDQKEGLYFGEELASDHPAVVARTPLHGANLFPERPPELAELVLEYMDALRTAGHRLMEAIALSLGLDDQAFRRQLTAEPLILFRIFHYPALTDIPENPSEDRESPVGKTDDRLWSVGEHTDYGLLTILLQDNAGGLQVRSRGRWVEAPPLPGTFVCNIGDMLERMSGGLFRSTPHRVLNRSGRSRLSFPFFFDPGFAAPLEPLLTGVEGAGSAQDRWDGTDVHEWGGTYGEYVLQKIGKVFPDLGDEVL